MKYLFVVLLMFTAGCSEREQPGIKNPSQTDVRSADLNRVEDIISNRNGRILFVNVWATWCIPCVEEFPYLVKIYNEYKDTIDFLSLSADFGSNTDSVVSSFLTSQQAEFPVYVIEETSTQEIINLLNTEWSGAIPATLIFDAGGERQKFILGAHDYNYFKQSIDSVLAL